MVDPINWKIYVLDMNKDTDADGDTDIYICM